MKNLLSVLLVVLAMVVPAAVQAAGPKMVQGTISTNTVWEASNGPYMVQGKVVIEKGATLTLRPGTTVNFISISSDPTGGSGFVVQGGLEALGTTSEPVFFSPMVKGKKWGQLYYQNSNGLHSILSHCVITGGRVVCSGSSLTIEQCVLTGSNNAVVIGPGSTPRIVGNLIAGNNIGLTFLDGTSGSVVMNNFIYANEYGVCAENFGDSRMAMNQVCGNRLSDQVDPIPGYFASLHNQSSDAKVLQVADRKY